MPSSMSFQEKLRGSQVNDASYPEEVPAFVERCWKGFKLPDMSEGRGMVLMLCDVWFCFFYSTFAVWRLVLVVAVIPGKVSIQCGAENLLQTTCIWLFTYSQCLSFGHTCGICTAWKWHALRFFENSKNVWLLISIVNSARQSHESIVCFVSDNLATLNIFQSSVKSPKTKASWCEQKRSAGVSTQAWWPIEVPIRLQLRPCFTAYVLTASNKASFPRSNLAACSPIEHSFIILRSRVSKQCSCPQA